MLLSGLIQLSQNLRQLEYAFHTMCSKMEHMIDNSNYEENLRGCPSNCCGVLFFLPEGVVAAVETVLLAGVGELFFDEDPGFVLAENVWRFALGFGKGADCVKEIALGGDEGFCGLEDAFLERGAFSELL